MRIASIAALGATLLLAAPAMANTLILSAPAYSCVSGVCHQSFDTGVQATDWKPLQSNLYIFELNLFDTSLGTLNSVTFNTTASSSITGGTLKNNSATSQTFDFTQSTKFTATSANANLNSALAGLNLNPTYDTGTVSLNHGATLTLTPATHSSSGCIDAPTASGSCLTTALSTFSTFGGGTTDVTLATNTTDSLSGGGGLISFNVTTNGEATLAVVYNYTPKRRIPEPVSAALLGSALLGLAFARRRRT